MQWTFHDSVVSLILEISNYPFKKKRFEIEFNIPLYASSVP